MENFSGKTVVITGGTRGFGLAMARAFLQAGAQVVIASRRAESVEKALLELDAGERAAGQACDVAELEQVQKLADLAVARFGKFDVWINNAAIAGPYGPTMGFSPSTFHSVLQTNIVGVYNGSHVALKHFLPRKAGKLLNILGQGYDSPSPFQNAYGSSKTWTRVFTLALAKEHTGSGVGVFAFHPGMMLTDLLTEVEVISGSEEKLKVFPTIVRMWARPPEVPAQKAVWAASPATDGMTGKVIKMNTFGHMLAGAVREGLRRLLGKPAPPGEVRVRVVPYGES